MSCGNVGYDPFESTDAADALDQAASYLDCALMHAKRWPDITAAMEVALAVIRQEYKRITGKDW